MIYKYMISRIVVTRVSVLIFQILFSAIFTGVSFATHVSTKPFFSSDLTRQYGEADSFAEFHGFVSTTYGDAQKEGSNNGVPKLEMEEFYLSAFSSIRENVYFLGEVEYEHSGDEIKLEQALVHWNFSEILRARVGKMFVPFGIEKPFSTQAPNILFAKRAFVLDELAYGDWADTGVNLFGLVKFIPDIPVTYNIGIFKGPAGLTKPLLENRENNGDKTFISRLTVYPFNSDMLEAGISYAAGKYNDIAESPMGFRLAGADLNFKTDRFLLAGEYISRSGADDNRGAATVKADASGYYVHAGYKLFKDMQNINYIMPVYRIEKVDLNEPGAGGYDSLKRNTLGIVYSPIENILFKAEYQIIDEGKNNLDNDAFYLQLVADF